MTVKTVGELKKALESMNDDIPLEFVAYYMDRGKSNSVVVDRLEVPYDKGIALYVYDDAGYCRIENLNSTDLRLED